MVAAMDAKEKFLKEMEVLLRWTDKFEQSKTASSLI